jgi:hypothetical protein
MTPDQPDDAPRAASGGGRWHGFLADVSDRPAKALHEQGNEQHRVRVEHDRYTVFVHLSDEDGKGWTTMAVDRQTRAAAIGQARSQHDAAREAYTALHGPASSGG